MNYNYLKIGDVIKINNGMVIYAGIPETNTKEIKVGSIISKPISDNSEICSNEAETFNTNIFAGEYVVIKTASTGQGSGYNDTNYPDGYKVVCKKLKYGNYDTDGLEIFFYQSGCFTVVIGRDKIQPIRQMTILN